MSKSTIARTWIAGLGLLAAGAIACAAAIALILVYFGTFISISDGFRFTPQPDAYFWTLVGVCAIGCVGAFAGFIVQIAAWVGALVNTNQLADKTWFAVLLVTGTLAFTGVLAPVGLAGMAAYLVSGPDGTRDQEYAINERTGAAATIAPAS
jgi:hypothetical protein